MRIQLPEKVSKIINCLTEAGYEAYAVGGCVRDTLLGRTPGDWDITTSAKPAEVKALFGRTIDTGILHGTVTVMLGKEGLRSRLTGSTGSMRTKDIPRMLFIRQTCLKI